MLSQPAHSVFLLGPLFFYKFSQTLFLIVLLICQLQGPPYPGDFPDNGFLTSLCGADLQKFYSTSLTHLTEWVFHHASGKKLKCTRSSWNYTPGAEQIYPNWASATLPGLMMCLWAFYWKGAFSGREVWCAYFWKTEFINFFWKIKLQPHISSAHFSLTWSISYVFQSIPSADTVLET